MDVRTELSEFLKTRRARLTPADVGLPTYGGQRRVAGLRREELAQAAGVSVAHYTRLEQGHTRSVSPEVVDAIVAALRLNQQEREYLHRLVRPPRAAEQPATATATADVRPGLQHLLDSMELTPAFVVGSRSNIVAWNRIGAAVFGDLAALPPQRRTWSHLIFLDEAFRLLHGTRWWHVARTHVAYIRTLAAQHPQDTELTAHLDAMRVESREFRRLWETRDVAAWTNREYVLQHPTAGELRLAGEWVLLPNDPGMGLELCVPEPGTPSETQLRLLTETTDRKSSGQGLRAKDAADPPAGPAPSDPDRRAARLT